MAIKQSVVSCLLVSKLNSDLHFESVADYLGRYLLASP